MRYAEFLRLYDNPTWYNKKKNLIHLPQETQKKHKRRQLERTIHPLPSMFSYLLKDFWQARRPPLESTWNKNLQRWAQGAGLNPCLLYTSPSPRDRTRYRMPSSA